MHPFLSVLHVVCVCVCVCVHAGQVGVRRIPSHKFLPLMYQLAARMGTKMTTDTGEDVGFHDVLSDVRGHFNGGGLITGKCWDWGHYPKERRMIFT